jgi:hypothetical protein
MMQLLAGSGPYAITKTWYVDGTATDVGAVTIGITDGNGDTVITAGTATTNNSNGTYTYSLADQANPDQLTLTWTRVTTGADLVDRVELVGGWLFTEAQARSFAAKADTTSALIPLASSTEYTDAMIADERARIGDNLEYWTGRSWIPRYARVEVPGSGTGYQSLRTGRCRTADGYALNRPARLNDIAELLSVTVNGTAVDVADVEIDQLRSWLVRPAGIFASSATADPFNVVVEYVYGMPYQVDDVDRIALKLLVDRLVPSAFPDRALRWDGADGSSLSLVQAGGPLRNVSRLPEVNQWVTDHNHKILVG